MKDQLEESTFSEGRIERLDEALECENLKTPSIAVPSSSKFVRASGISEDDILQTGQSLLTVMAKRGVNLVVHGHRHFPHITHIKTDEGGVPVFGAGSFSRALGSIGTYARNLFQMIYFEPPEARPALRGGG
ncbi:MAG: hypothetical protein IPM80_23465 [Proteobacteria bacterium]|nr:hypothetical protein [Pseudomonadota bacterium]